MKYRFVAILILLFALLSSVARAEREVGEGYAIPTYKEIYQTMTLLGAVDITNPKVADEYARLMYCDQYKQFFSNDIAWNKVRKEITDHVSERRQYYRIMYEVVGIFKLGRYNFEKQYFPFSADTAIKNVGSIPLFTQLDYKPYCDDGGESTYFPSVVNLVLNRPLTLTQVDLPVDNIEKVLARMAETKNKERYLFGRVRFRVLDARLDQERRSSTANLLGEVQAVDFFFDRDLTKLVASVQIAH